MTTWVDVVARVRGLSTRVLSPALLEGIARTRDVRALAEALSTDLTLPRPPDLPHDAGALELAARRRAAARLRILGRWAGERAPLLAPLFDDEDRRSVRAMLRGATVGATPEARLAGLIPTPSLPERALEELARAGDVASVTTRLVTWGHPFGAPLRAATAGPKTDLLRAEEALVRAFAERAVRAARKGGGAMRTYVARVIDVENAWTAVLRAGAEPDAHRVTAPGDGPAEGFCPGGRLVRQSDFVHAVRASDAAEAARRLAARLAGSPIAGALDQGEEAPDDAVLRGLLREQSSIARIDPLGLAPVIAFVLRQRRELRAVQRVAWSIALGVPGELAARGLRGAT